MKHKILFCIFLISLFSSCQNNISYTITNQTDYDVVIIDLSEKSKPEYHINRNSELSLDHTTKGHFVLKDNSEPIELINYYSFSEIRNLKSYDILVKNQSGKAFKLVVKNSTHNSTNELSISTDSSQTIKIYANYTPEIQLLDGQQISYTKFTLINDVLTIY